MAVGAAIVRSTRVFLYLENLYSEDAVGLFFFAGMRVISSPTFFYIHIDETRKESPYLFIHFTNIFPTSHDTRLAFLVLGCAFCLSPAAEGAGKLGSIA